MLEVAIRKRRRDLTIEAEFNLEAGTALGLFGPSGAGKSTVLTCIAGLEAPDRGHVRLNGATLFPPMAPLHHRALGYLTQEPLLFPHLSVGENVAFSLQRPNRERAWLDRLRQQLGLAECWQAPAPQISGGQARRVALARALARRPKLMLLDEPFTGLDRDSVRGLISALLEWQRELGFALLVVDHEAPVLSRLCPQALVMDRGQELRRGSWAELAQDAHPRLQSLLAPL